MMGLVSACLGCLFVCLLCVFADLVRFVGVFFLIGERSVILSSLILVP